MNNKIDKTVEISIWIIMSFLLLKFVPRHRIREAQVIFLFKQIITWLFGLLVTEKNLISYPSRLFFKKATKSSFTFEYFAYPALCALFNLYYPEEKYTVKKLSYYFFHTSLITSFEMLCLKFTSLIRYKKWKWYSTFITIWSTYYLSHIYHRWFFKS